MMQPRYLNKALSYNIINSSMRTLLTAFGTWSQIEYEYQGITDSPKGMLLTTSGTWGLAKVYVVVTNLYELLGATYDQNLSPYGVFVNLKTTFGLTDRTLLWAYLSEKGAEGRLFGVLKELYKGLTAAIHMGN